MKQRPVLKNSHSINETMGKDIKIIKILLSFDLMNHNWLVNATAETINIIKIKTMRKH